MTTTMTTRENAMANTEFILPAMVEGEFSAEELAEDMDGLQMSFPRVKIPGGGSLMFEITMHPRKSMIHCFQYINRKAYEYVQDELKANGIKLGTGANGYGSDIPDDLCYQWAEEYFRDPTAKEDQIDEEKFVPRPYKSSVKIKKTEKKKPEPAKTEKPKPAEDAQISFDSLM